MLYFLEVAASLASSVEVLVESSGSCAQMRHGRKKRVRTARFIADRIDGPSGCFGLCRGARMRGPSHLSSVVEQLFRKQQVVGSSPTGGSSLLRIAWTCHNLRRNERPVRRRLQEELPRPRAAGRDDRGDREAG